MTTLLWRRRRPPLLSLFSVVLLLSLLHDSTHAWIFRSVTQNTANHGSTIQQASPPSTQADQTTASSGSGELPQPLGHNEYQEAIQILHSIRPPPRRLARFTKPTSMFGTTVYYARQLVYLLFMNGPQKSGSTSSAPRKLSEPLRQAEELLRTSSVNNNQEAMYKLAHMSFYGTHTFPRNYTQAFDNYLRLADLYGNSTAQHMIGFMHATGIGNVVEKDQAKALLYHTFAANAGDIRAQMTLGYRHLSGIATPRNCKKAVHYYKKVADKAMAYVRSGPPGGHQVSKEAARLSDEDGGIYGLQPKSSNPVSSENGRFGDVLEYIYLMSKKGDIKATFAIGKMHYEGSRALQRDFRTAKGKFLEVARRYWTQDGKIRQDTEPDVDKTAAKAAGYLGRMYLRGEGLEQNFAKAHIWFRRGVANGDALCQYSLGIMFLHGLGAAKDPVRAAEFFGAAADQGFATAQVRLGALFLDQGNLETAYKYFELAADNGHIEAFYFLAEIANLGLVRERNCNQAAHFYKIVAEKAESVHSSFGEANDAYEDGDIGTALQLYMQAAEQGYEEAQSNVAYVLDRNSGASKSQLARMIASASGYLSMGQAAAAKAKTLLGDAGLALIYWTRSANQANIESLLKMGDYYLIGLGVPPTANSSHAYMSDPEKAAACYSAAADTQRSAQAYWNLGWMHENGLGVEQDFHLAKRFYDQCVETNKDARAPVTIALAKLRVRSWWNWITGGKVQSMHPADEAGGRKAKYSLSEWFANFLLADLEDMQRAERNNEIDDWDGTLGGGRIGGPDGEQGIIGEEYWGEGGDSLLEVAVIVSLATALAALVWFRQMAALRERRRQAQAAGGPYFAPPPEVEPEEAEVFAPAPPTGAAAQETEGEQCPTNDQGPQAAPADNGAYERGLNPNPGEREFQEWVAGGVGQ